MMDNSKSSRYTSGSSSATSQIRPDSVKPDASRMDAAKSDAAKLDSARLESNRTPEPRFEPPAKLAEPLRDSKTDFPLSPPASGGYTPSGERFVLCQFV